MLRSVLVASAVVVALVSTGAAVAAGGAAPVVKFKALAVPLSGFGLPRAEVLSRNGTTLYVAGDSGLVAINLKRPSAAPVAITDAGQSMHAFGLALAPNGKILYISGAPKGGSEAVYIADVSGSKSDKHDDTVVGSLSDPHGVVTAPEGLAIAHNGKTLYIANINDIVMPGEMPQGDLAIAALKTPTQGTILTDHTAVVNGFATALALSPSGKLIYESDIYGSASVVRISGQEYKTVTALPEVTSAYGLALSPDGRTLYSSNEGSALSGSGTVPPTFDTFAVRHGGLSADLARATPLAADQYIVTLSLTATGKLGYATTTSSFGMSPVVGVAKFAVPPAQTEVRLTGHDRAGSRLTAQVKGAFGASFTFQWYADGKAIKGAHKSSLKLTSKLKGKTISVKVTAEAVGYSPATLHAKEQAPVA